MSQNQLNRPPRLQPRIPDAQIEIPPPPQKDEQQTQTLFEIAVPLVSIMAYLLIALSGRGTSLLFVLPMAVTMILSVGATLFRNRRIRLEIERKTKAYEQRLGALRGDMRDFHQVQRDFYEYNYPDTPTTLKIAHDEQGSRSGTRLWERRPEDPDFGALRLGTGVQPSRVVYTLPSGDNDEDPQMDDARRLVEDSRHVTQVPVLLDLAQLTENEEAARVQPTIGIYAVGSSNGTEIVTRYVQSLIVHFATFHSYTDASLIVAASTAAKRDERWRWLDKLPHVRRGSICYEDEEVNERDNTRNKRMDLFFRELRIELQTRQQRLRERGSAEFRLPFLLVLVDMRGAAPDSTIRNADREQAVGLIMREGAHLGAAVIFLVDQPDQVPTDCSGVIELESDADVHFRYAEVGVNTPRYVGRADLPEDAALNRFAEALSRHQVRMSAAASLKTSIDLLQLHNVDAIPALNILSNWERSRTLRDSWPCVEIGLGGNNDPCKLVFSADASGVHGMIAGTTGSGKSELLLTLITGLAINYDPSIVNFVLVDFKGGSAFNEFRTLPHCVAVITNLSESKAERMFAAIKAELDRRGKLIADTKVKHIVEYRDKGYHRTREPFPHLFIIIDEFAEMVTQNTDFKAQLDSITRLGRAIGVSLILATQRPAGAITDQMRANMKFRICLRVETPQDSRELLATSDAAYLPPGLPGRGYLQIGNDQPELIQVARAGGTYRYGAQKTLDLPPVVFPGRKREQESQDEPTLSRLIVQEMAALAKDAASDVREQGKPWPDPLPIYLPLDKPISLHHLSAEEKAELRRYEVDETPKGLPLNPTAARWLAADDVAWDADIWDRPDALTAVIGLIDNPRRARQLLMRFGLDEHTVLFGGSGSGKTTFLQTLIVALAARHSPADLHIYILDFGSKTLDPFRNLPHVGDVIARDDRHLLEKMTRLLRQISETVSDRQNLFSDTAANLIAYNQQPHVAPLPALLVVIDNFAEIKENYDNLLPTLIGLLRDGRSAGVSFIVTADTSSAVSGKLLSMFRRRLVLQMPDSGEYAGLLGRGAPLLDEVYGRGLLNIGDRKISRTPLEFQAAAPFGLPVDELIKADDLDTHPTGINEPATVEKLAGALLPLFRTFIDAQRARWKTAQPPHRRAAEAIRILPAYVPLPSLPKHVQGQRGLYAILGVEDRQLEPLAINLEADGPHFLIVGQPFSGRSALLRTWMLSLAMHYSPQQVAIFAVDPLERLTRGRLPDAIPHLRLIVSEGESLRVMIDLLRLEYEGRAHGAVSPRPQIYVFIDNYDDMGEIAAEKDRAELGRLASLYAADGLHFILCGSEEMPRATGSDELLRRAKRARYGFALQTEKAVEALEVRKIPASLKNAEFAPGRGFLVKSGRPTLVQIATFDHENGEPDLTALAEAGRRVQHWTEPPHSFYYDQLDAETREKRLAELRAAPPPGAAAVPRPANGASVAALDDAALVTALPSDEMIAYFLDAIPRLPLDLLTRMDVKIAPIYPYEQLHRFSGREHLEQFIRRGDVTLPTSLDPALRAQAEQHLSQHLVLFDPLNLALLPPALVEALGIRFASERQQKRFMDGGLSADDLRRAIANQTLILPTDIPPATSAQAHTLIALYRLLTGEVLHKMPLDLLTRLNLDLSRAGRQSRMIETVDEQGRTVKRPEIEPLTLDDIAQGRLTPAEIDKAIRALQIRLPAAVEPDLLADLESYSARRAAAPPQQGASS